jgi:hypothetical protein
VNYRSPPDHSLYEQQRNGPHIGGGGDTTSGSSRSSESDAEVNTLNKRNTRGRKVGKGDSFLLHFKHVEDQVSAITVVEGYLKGVTMYKISESGAIARRAGSNCGRPGSQ